MTKSEAIQQAKVLKLLLDIAKINKINTSFIPAFKKAIPVGDTAYLTGNFNLGSVKSGRMSSNSPNLQQIPSSGSIYAKPIKRCFCPPKGWVILSADFNALEARIDALLTKDRNKVKVYVDGYDSHSLNSQAYWADQMPDIDPNSVESINSIKDKYPKLRQASKSCTFALQFSGTEHTLVKNSGFSMEEATKIVANYKELYKESIAYTQAKLKEASETGYVVGAFGLKLRTPLLKQVLWGTNNVPYEAQAEARTAGNMLAQSFGLLNNRSINEFLDRVHKAGYSEKILPICMIHDSQYFLAKRDCNIVKWVNDNLIECMEWQELPEIAHDQVKLGAELECYLESWANPIAIKNHASLEDIQKLIELT